MAEKRSKGFIQLEWECPNCSSRNPGPVKTCQNCGAPQPENVEFLQPAEQKLVTEAKSIEAAKAGADIHCGFCGTRNPATATVCSQCGADLKEGKARHSGRVMQPAPAGPKTVNCTNCGTENPSANTVCLKCGAPLPRAIAPQPVTVQPRKAPPAAPKKAPWLLLGGIAAMLLCACFAAWYFFVAPAVSLEATVTDILWQTSVPLQEQSEVRHNDEAGSPPSDAYDVSCRNGTEQICEQKTVDRGNGYAEIVEECHDQTTQYCSYTMTEWETIQMYTLDGHDLFPVYADPSIASGQRTGSPSEDYTVYFDTAQGIKTYSPGDLDEFQQFQVGSVWTLKLNRADAILSVEP
jgi:hypothetical protein